ncbi:MAG TPA: lysylphosphatidylglycerol synthase transmembrane domain-containing protein [Bacteroidota bacterium]|nr:lysylphosphatidylglycerol synthase transmembrane domain-containing protein [Bacteroidota bacterium]
MNGKTAFRTSLSFLLAGIFLYATFRGTNFSDLWESIKGVRYIWVIAVIPVTILSHWLRAVRWSYLLAPVKTSFRTRNLFSAVMIGYAVNNILPRVGELVRPMVLGRLENVSKSSALATVVVERILDFLTFYFVVCIVLFLYPDSLDPFVKNVSTARPLLLAASLAAFVFFALLFFRAEPVFRFFGRLAHLSPKRYEPRIEEFVRSFLSGLSDAAVREKMLAILSMSLVIWLLYALAMYLPFFAYNSLAPFHLSFGDSIVLLTITSIAWVLPAPGAMGTYHSFLTIALVKLYGVDRTTALSFSIVTHELGYIIVMLIGGYYFFRDHFDVRVLAPHSQKANPGDS